METLEKPINAFLLDVGVGVSYMGIWRVTVHAFGVSRSSRPREIAIISRGDLLWSMTEEHKPKRQPKEPDRASITRSMLAFSPEELKVQFAAALDKHFQDSMDSLTRTEGSINYLLDQIRGLSGNMAHTRTQLVMIRGTSCPDLV